MKKSVLLFSIILVGLFAFLPHVAAVNISTCITFNDTSNLTANIESNESCLTFGSDNITLDCLGFNITYGVNGSNAAHGISASDRVNITVQNCVIRDINVSGARGVGINFTRTNDSLILNNNITTNGTNDNYGVLIHHPSKNNRIVNNTITTRGGGSDNYGINLLNSSTNTTITGNAVSTNGTSTNLGIRLSNLARNNTIINNSISTRGTVGTNIGIRLITIAFGNVVANNTIRTNGTASNDGIELLTTVHDNFLINNTIITGGTADSNVGINLEGTNSNNSIQQNTINTTGTQLNFGIELDNPPVTNNTIANNTISTSGSSSENVGIILDGVAGNTVMSNVVRTNGTTLNYGIRLLTTGASNNTIANNTIVTGSTSSGDNIGIYVSCTCSNNTIDNNTITAFGSGSNNHGIRVDASSNSTFNGNNITTRGTTSYGLFFGTTQVPVDNIFINLFLSNPVAWISSSAGSFNNFTNTTFANVQGNGNIRFPNLFTLNGSQDITLNKLNVTSNNAFLNSTNLTFLNVSAQITLRNIVASNPVMRSDFDDDGVFQNCPASICVQDSYAGGTFVFNVTQFTSYTTTEGNTTVTKTDNADPANASSNLTYNITVTITLSPEVSNVSNLTLNDTYPPQVIFLAAQPAPLTGTNNTFILGNFTANQVIQVNITVFVHNVTNGTVINNTANITYHNSTGQQINASVTENTTISLLPLYNFTNISITKIDAPDPVDNGTQLNYTIFVNATGNTTASNVTVTEAYPSQVIFNSAQPAPLTGTNTTFVLGNLSPGTNFTINITVNVSSTVTNRTVINNTVNVSFQNETSQVAVNRTATQNTTVQNVTITVASDPAPSTSSGGGGGGGGSGPLKTFSWTTSMETYDVKRTDRIVFTVNQVQHTITVLNVQTNQVLLRVNSEVQEFWLAVGASRDVDVDQDDKTDVRVILLSVAYNKASLRVERLDSPCIGEDCAVAVIPEHSQEPISSPPTTSSEPDSQALPADTLMAGDVPAGGLNQQALTRFFYALALLTLGLLCGYWWWLQQRNRTRNRKL